MLSLSIRKLCTHSQSSYGVYTLQAHVWFKIFKFSREIIFFILTLSTHVSGFTLHTVIWFTLSKHMLGSKFSNFHGSFFFILTLSTHVSGFTLHTVIWFTLSKHMLGSKFSNFHGSFFFILTLSTHVSGFTLHTVTLQAHVRFNIFEFSQKLILFILTLSTHISGFTLHTVIWLYGYIKISQEIIISCLHSPHMFQGSLSIQLFGLHSPSTC